MFARRGLREQHHFISPFSETPVRIFGEGGLRRQREVSTEAVTVAEIGMDSDRPQRVSSSLCPLAHDSALGYWRGMPSQRGSRTEGRYAHVHARRYRLFCDRLWPRGLRPG